MSDHKPPQSAGVLAAGHKHIYHLVASDMVVVRWCEHCGCTDIIERKVTGGSFESTWKPIREAAFER